MKRISKLLLLVSSCLVMPAVAEIYRYKDASGKWQYSDVKPADQTNVVEVELETPNTVESIGTTGDVVVAVPADLCPSDKARRSNYYQRRKAAMGTKGTWTLDHHKQKGRHSLSANNTYFAPMSVKVWLENASDVRTIPTLPTIIEVPPHTKKEIVEFGPKYENKRWRYWYRTDSQLGKLIAKQDVKCYFLPPVPAGKTFRVSQSFNGKFSHKSGGSQYAVDIGMEVGTPIVAARDGIVITRKQGFVLSGLTEKHKRQANVVQILHGDGTIATYAHLQFATLRLYEGEQVKAGQVIGLSGNTGYSTGPHLHFAIAANKNMKWQSVPFQFLLNGKPHTPKRGSELQNSPHN